MDIWKKYENINMDEACSFRFILYKKNLIFETEYVVCRSPWWTSISFCRQSAEIKILDLQDNNLSEDVPTSFDDFDGKLYSK
jgi:hypothetical protein